MLKRTTKPLKRRVLTEEGLATSSKKQHSENTDKWHLCKAGSFSYGESPRTPPLEGTSLHRWNNSVERPWGILSLFTTCLRLCVKSPCHRLSHVDYPKRHTRRKEPLRNAKQDKTTRRAGYKKVYKKTNKQRKHSESNEPDQMLNKTKTLTIGRQKKAKEKALKSKNEPVTLERSPTKTPLRRTEPYKMLTRTTKPLRRRVLTEEGLAKSSTK